jgi:type VI secretion system protein ImpE
MTMLADQTLKEGRVDEALEQLQERVRKDPSNAKYRTFLFQLLAVTGQWERAMTQLKVVGDLDAATLPMVQMYREALHCEALRARVFAGGSSPLVFGDPEPWIAHVIEALRGSAEGRHAEAAEVRDRALEEAPATPGTIDGEPFAWIADADSRLGPLVEAIVNGRYYWVPFHRIRRIAVEEPSDLRDVVWTPVHFTWANGGEAVGLIPTRYPGSESSDDNLIRLARKTDWPQVADDVYEGRGQRMYATDSGEYPLMDVRSIELSVAEPTSEQSGAEDAAE